MKKIIALILVIVVLFALCACNYKMIDTNWEFNYAYITLPNGDIKEVEVKKWKEDGNSITIQAEDGQVYSVSYHNCLMTKNKWER